MAYVTIEDDTAALELIVFSNGLNQYGGYLKENQAIVVTGRLSLRDDKEPQIVLNRARLITDFANDSRDPEAPSAPAEVRSGTLYLKLPTENGSLFGKIRSILSMFPGESTAVVYFADTGVRRGTRCTLDSRMLEELQNVLGKENVVVK